LGQVTPVLAGDLLVLNATFSDIELHRQQVLNPMSHAPTVPISTVEVHAAIDAVDALIVGLDKVPQ